MPSHTYDGFRRLTAVLQRALPTTWHETSGRFLMSKYFSDTNIMRGFLNFVRAKRNLPYLKNLDVLRLSISLSSIYCEPRSSAPTPPGETSPNCDSATNLESRFFSCCDLTSVVPDDSISNIESVRCAPQPEPSAGIKIVPVLTQSVPEHVDIVGAATAAPIPHEEVLTTPPLSTETVRAQVDTNGVGQRKRSRAVRSDGSTSTVVSRASKVGRSSGTDALTVSLSAGSVDKVKDFLERNQILAIESPPSLKMKCKRFAKFKALLSASGLTGSCLDATSCLGGSAWLCFDGPTAQFEEDGGLLPIMKTSWTYAVKEHGWNAQVVFIEQAFRDACQRTKGKCTCP